MYEKRYLVMLDVGKNNYKYYQMEEADGKLLVTYGRMGQKGQTLTYSLDQWDKKYNEKIKKGYKDMSDVYLTAVCTDDLVAGTVKSNSAGQRLYNRLAQYAKDLVNGSFINYSNAVSEKMVSKARECLDQLYQAKTVKAFNATLTELLELSPRKVKNIGDLLAKKRADFADIIQREDDLIDAMEVLATQEKLQREALEKEREKNPRLATLPDDYDMFDLMGIDVWDATDEQIESVMDHLSNQLKPKVKKIYRVINHKHKERFDAYVKDNNITEVKQLFHGSRNENWLSITARGLLLKPNAIITGKMFGNGIYFAPSSMKSWGYTSYSGSYWANGNSKTAFMGLYATAYGTPYNVDTWSTEDYEKSVKNGDFNCLHAHAGASLRNDEIVFYTESAMLLNYIIEFE